MESKKYLGVYLSKNTATVVCLEPQGRNFELAGCFSVTAEETEGATTQELANLIGKGCAERNLKFSEVTVALDCALFMQHSVHSEFTEPKKIAATVRFDTEGAIAADISEVAIAFKIISTDAAGT